MISVSRTYLPPLEEYNKYLKRIWKSNWLTNDGELVRELEKKLQDYWGVKNVVCVNNGTTAIQIALRAMGITKKVYMYPNSFVATAEAPAWINIKPVFLDVNEDLKYPALVTHTYGIPHLVPGGPVIYDASHAFTTKVDGKSVLKYGDVSIISFHAVKMFQTVEGGAVVTDNDVIANKARWMRNHGFKTHYTFYGAGTNAKMSEFHAAMGLCSLPLVDKMRKKYDELIEKYNTELGLVRVGVSYYPVWYPSERKLLKAIKEFEKHDIYPRRYFYPALNKVFGGKPCPLIEESTKRVMCLPLYYELKDEDQDLIIKIVKETL